MQAWKWLTMTWVSCQAWSEHEANPHFSAYYMAQLPHDLSADWAKFTACLARQTHNPYPYPCLYPYP